MARYDSIGQGYARSRREDPLIAQALARALGEGSSVVNVGAGAGSYEPTDRQVIAIEPSAVMAAQRPAHLAVAISATAGALPLFDDSVDGAMSVLSLHHWDAEQEAGVREMRRVARGPVAIVTYDAEVCSRMWLMADYVPEVAELDRRIFPSMNTLRGWLGGQVTVEELPVPRDSPDWNLGSFWAHPDRVLDKNARNATSGFARLDERVVRRVVAAVRSDLENGTWDERYGHLRSLAAYDVGLRLVVGNI